MSVDVAHFDPWKRRCLIQELVWHKWFRVRVCLPGQRVEEKAAGTPGYTDSRGRDLTIFMYITEKRPRDEVYTGEDGRGRVAEIH